MNTLSRAVTARFFATLAEYQAIQQQWSKIINSTEKHKLTAAHHTLYLALRGKDWRKSFTLTQSQKRLQNGAFQGWALFRALAHIHAQWAEAELLAPFNGLVTPSMLEALRPYLPKPNAYKLHPSQFANRHWPFDAYQSMEGETNE